MTNSFCKKISKERGKYFLCTFCETQMPSYVSALCIIIVQKMLSRYAKANPFKSDLMAECTVSGDY